MRADACPHALPAQIKRLKKKMLAVEGTWDTDLFTAQLRWIEAYKSPKKGPSTMFTLTDSEVEVILAALDYAASGGFGFHRG